MNKPEDKDCKDQWPVAASGQWLYDGVVPYQICIYRIPARFSGTRYDEDEQLDHSLPIPETPDGYVYQFSGFGKEFGTLAEALKWGNEQPWGPIRWYSELPKDT